MSVPLHAQWVLRAVKRWAIGYVMLPELSAGLGVGRFDGLLIPVARTAHCMTAQRGPFWRRPCLVGVEVKTSRNDFLAGLRKGQYERYRAGVSALYVATPTGVCKTTELPKGIGHLVVPNERDAWPQWRIVCKRHPHYERRALAADVAWDCLFHAYWQLDDELNEERERQRQIMEQVGKQAGALVFGPLKQIERAVAASLDNGRSGPDRRYRVPR